MLGQVLLLRRGSRSLRLRRTALRHGGRHLLLLHLLILLDFLHEQDLLLFGQLLLLLQVVALLLLLSARAALGRLVVLGDHVGLRSGGFRLGLVRLELVLAGQVSLLRAEHAGWTGGLPASGDTSTLPLDEDVRVRLSPRRRRGLGQLAFGADVDLLVAGESFLLYELLVRFLLLLLLLLLDGGCVRVLHVALVWTEGPPAAVLHLGGGG